MRNCGMHPDEKVCVLIANICVKSHLRGAIHYYMCNKLIIGYTGTPFQTLCSDSSQNWKKRSNLSNLDSWSNMYKRVVVISLNSGARARLPIAMSFCPASFRGQLARMG